MAVFILFYPLIISVSVYVRFHEDFVIMTCLSAEKQQHWQWFINYTNTGAVRALTRARRFAPGRQTVARGLELLAGDESGTDRDQMHSAQTQDCQLDHPDCDQLPLLKRSPKREGKRVRRWHRERVNSRSLLLTPTGGRLSSCAVHAPLRIHVSQQCEHQWPMWV